MLPIVEKKKEIVELLKNNQVVIIAGETGSGKTTQVPQFCFESGFAEHGKIAVTQPRRIAATSTAQRVAEEMETALGNTVGYKIRFSEKVSDDSKVVFMTDGMLLNELQHDRLLRKYSVIIIDEAHERSLNIDFLLGYLKSILPKRKDLTIVVSSATIDTALFSKMFDNAPVIEVSGRLYPVEVIYEPLEDSEEGDFGSYVTATVTMVDQIIGSNDPGDILIFMPTEKDIHETVGLLEGRKFDGSIILPLFARLTQSQQNKIFQPNNKRKIVIATNIAETSITVPGIKFVIDTGLARISKYAPRLRTNRLPIEEVSQASANQRKGRCGRVSDGLCIRLYSEETFLQREEFTLPEIKRSNLAGVILTMLSIGLGDINKFPFVEPPSKQSITDGFSQLKELGAINKNRRLTKLGWKMGKLPLEPHVSRMLIEAENRGCLRETAIIAAGLSIVDPRERPFDKKEAADLMHKKFLNADSDFLTLLKIWDTYQEEWESLRTQNKMRKFCKEHFLSFNRMREWHDVFNQIRQMVSRNKAFHFNGTQGNSEDIHRSILTGLLSSIAEKKEKGGYSTTRNKESYIFPASVFFKKNPQWLMCHEIVETSKTFLRTVAPIKPQWIEEIAPHLCKYTYGEPFFDEKDVVVKVPENVLFFGLPVVKNRMVAYRKVNPEIAAEIFYREGLVSFHQSIDLPFIHSNKKIYNSVASLEDKHRKRGFVLGDEELVGFYKERLPHTSSLQELKSIIRQKGGDAFLRMTEDDLYAQNAPEEETVFPDSLDIGGKKYTLSYEFNPGHEKDGVTVKVPIEDTKFIQKETFGWLVEPLWNEKVQALLKSLPKQKRKVFVPIPDSAKKICDQLQYRPITFVEAICEIVKYSFPIVLSPEDFKEESLPDHLKMRIEITTKKKKIVASGKDFSQLQNVSYRGGEHKRNVSDIEKQFKKYEEINITSWTKDIISSEIEVLQSQDGIPLYGYPAYVSQEYGVTYKLFSTPSDALFHHRKGVRKLLELSLSKELLWLEKEMKLSKDIAFFIKPFFKETVFKKRLISLITNYALYIDENAPRSKDTFDRKCFDAKETLKGIAYKTLTLLENFFELYTENYLLIEKCSAKGGTYLKEIEKELYCMMEDYINRMLKDYFTYEQLQQYPRYMRAFRYCIEKAFTATSQYTDRIKQGKVHLRERDKIAEELNYLSVNFKKKNHFLLLVEEFLISLFAQQIKTIYPVSEKRLEKALHEAR